MDYSQALKDAENSLRDFIEFIMVRKYGSDWYEKSGLSSDRITRCRERQKEEENKSGTIVPYERLTYYMMFEELKTIVDKNWNGEFKKAFGNTTKFNAYWDILSDYRNPDAHRRELLPHQQALVEGVSGEVRTMITRYRSNLDEADGYFPRFESIRDSLGNTWIAGDSFALFTEMTLRPGDTLELSATASDPFDGDLQYAFPVNGNAPEKWSRESNVIIDITDKDIGTQFRVDILLRSMREYHASKLSDDRVAFYYHVLPKS